MNYFHIEPIITVFSYQNLGFNQELKIKIYSWRGLKTTMGRVSSPLPPLVMSIYYVQTITATYLTGVEMYANMEREGHTSDLGVQHKNLPAYRIRITLCARHISIRSCGCYSAAGWCTYSQTNKPPKEERKK